MRLRTFLLLFCSGIFALSSAQEKKSRTSASKPLTLFSVNGKNVSTDEFIYLYRKNHQDSLQDYTAEKIEEYLRLYTNFKLKVEEARRRGMDTTSAFKKEFNQYKEELRKPYLPGNNLTDSLVRMTYARMKEEVKASHILIGVSPDAPPADTMNAFNKIVELRNRIIAGEDFAKAAAEFSEDPSAKMNKGSLGYFTAMQMVYPFENAAYSTPVGEVSKPVRTRFGYHILQVHDRRPAKGEVEVSHIMVRTGDDKGPDQARNLIFDVFNELQAGMRWEEAVTKYSEDPSTKSNGGRLRSFGVGVMGNVPEFERVAFELAEPGQISDPVQTQYGWHIIRLEKKIPLATLEELAPNLKSRVARDERSQVSKQALQTKLKKELAFIEKPSVRDRILSLADSTLKTGKWKPAPQKLNEELFSLSGNPYFAGDFLSYARKNQKPNSQDPKQYLRQLYDNFVDESILALQEQRIIARNPEYRFLLNEYYEGILLFEIMEKEVWNKASEDSVGQRAYYEEHKSKYSAPERVNATFYSSASGDLISELKGLLDGDQKQVREFINKNRIRVESGHYKKGDKLVLNDVDWKKGVHRAENQGMHYLVSIKEILAPGTMSFEEARPQLISDYQNHLEEIWLKELRQRFPVKVNKKGRKLIFQQLQKN